MKRIAAAVSVIIGLVAQATAKPAVLPIVNLEFYGGQTGFDGDTASFYGNGSWTLAPVIKFSDRNMLIPSYSGAVRRTVQVQELVGGAVLTQSQQSHILNLKQVHRLGESAWKAKGRFGYAKELLRETDDESWGDGLFDYDKYVVGVEVEREGQVWRSLRTGFDVFTLRYPNYESLASTEYGSEISAGGNVLDLDAVDWLSGADLMLGERRVLTASLLVSPRLYRDAKVVEESGLFTSDKRRDLYLWNAYNIQQNFRPLWPNGVNMRNAVGFFTSWAINDSNQNNYDVQKTRFNENYYSYFEWQAGPRWNARFRERTDFGLGYTFIQRQYADRPVQNEQGDYQSGKVRTDIQLISTSLSYRLGGGFALQGSFAFQIADSNQKYEQTYQYDYDSTHFFIGVSYSN